MDRGDMELTLKDYNELDNYKDWIYDQQPCLFNVLLPEESYLVPKIKWEKYVIEPVLDEIVISQVNEILRKGNA